MGNSSIQKIFNKSEKYKRQKENGQYEQDSADNSLIQKIFNKSEKY